MLAWSRFDSIRVLLRADGHLSRCLAVILTIFVAGIPAAAQNSSTPEEALREAIISDRPIDRELFLDLLVRGGPDRPHDER